ncbi:uncharacterized protein [Miscanthus floridulus]|uniref:uncharacterized protein n=1 Tax=Miscanthus floridulus TaxID=154761 RepID=UPI003457F6EF
MLWERSRIVMDDGGGVDDFTFAAAQPPPRLLSAGSGGGCMGPPLLYPVFGRPRSPPWAAPAPEPETATARVPLGRLLLVDRDPSPPPPPAPADDVDDDEGLDSVPAEMFSPWSPGWSAAAASSSPARCKKSGSTGSVLRWRPRLAVGRSQSDGKEKFVFLSTASSGGSFGRRNQKGRGAVEGAASAGSAGGGGAHAWSYYVNNNKGGGARRRRSFLPYKQDLVGLFANAAVFRRSYLPF